MKLKGGILLAKVRNIVIDITKLEYKEPMNPKSFNNLLYMNYNKIEIIQMYNSLYKNFISLKAMMQEVEVKTNLYKDKLIKNNISLELNEDETREYVAKTRALIRSATKTFEDEFLKEVASYDEIMNYQVNVQLEKLKNSYKNSTEFSLIKINQEIEMLEDLLHRTYNSNLLLKEKNRNVLSLTSELRQQYASKEKILGRDVKRTAHLNVDKKVDSSKSEIDWKDLKDGVIVMGD